MKGSRVQAIIRELRGERIDIIEWSEDPAVFAANALSPAKVSKVEINSFEEKKLTVTVPEDQLSLAIGKKGQNVRLAAKLVGWHIDIRSAEEAARAAAAQLEAVMAGGEATLTDIRESLALDQITAERLKDRGIENIEQLSVLSVDELVDAIDVSFDQANEILDRAHRLLAQKHAREVRDARDAETSAAAAADETAADESASPSVTELSEEAELPEGAELSGGGEISEQALEAGFEPGALSTEAPPDEEAEVQLGNVTAQDTDKASMAEPEPTAEEAADEKDQERQFAPPPDAEPSPSRPGASAGPDFDAMSPSEVQIQEFLAGVSPGVEETHGPMPSSAFQALAPGEQVVPDSRAEWREEAGIDDSDEQGAEDLIASFDSPPAEEGPEVEPSEVELSEGEATGDTTPSEAAEQETGEETTDELSPEAFEAGLETGSEETATGRGQTGKDQEGAADTDEKKDQ
jgi:hypothetical protein